MLRWLMWRILIENWTSLAWLELKSIFAQRRSEKSEVLATEMVDVTRSAVEMTVVEGLTETIAVVDLSEMTVVEDSTETIAATMVATGIVLSAITIISLSDRNAIAVENRGEAIVMDSVQTTEVSNAASNAVDASSETTVSVTACKATGTARSATMTTLHGELNVTNVVHRSLEAKDALNDGMTEEETTDLEATIDEVVTEEATTVVVATEEGTTVEAAVKYSTTTTGSALSATIQISHSDKNATDVASLEMAVNPGLVEMTDGVATEEAAMTDGVATEEVAMTDGVATEEAAMTEGVATVEAAMTDDPLAVNLVNSERPVVRVQAMLTTGHLVT